MCQTIKALLVSIIKLIAGLFFWCWFKFLSSKSSNLDVSLPQARRLLIIAPHIDDDVLGAGGTLLLHSRRKDYLEVVYCTDGAKSYHPHFKGTKLAQLRRQEAELVAKKIGYNRCHFLGQPDGSLADNKVCQEKLAKIIKMANPAVIYLPFFLDSHPDHVAISTLMTNIFASKKTEDIQILAYSVTCPLTPAASNKFVDISQTFAEKCHILDYFKSQTMSFAAILNFNCFHAILLGKKAAFVECFLELPLIQYLALFDKYRFTADALIVKPLKNPLQYILRYLSNYKKQLELMRLGQIK